MFLFSSFDDANHRLSFLFLQTMGFGRLVYKDYKNIMCSLRFWQNSFKNHTKSTSGILRIENYREALQDIGYQLSTDILGLLVLRFMRKDCTLRFGDFVLSVLHLTIAFSGFDRRSEGLETVGSVRITLNEWLKAALQV